MRTRSSILLFILTIFVLSSLSMVAFYVREFALAFWLTMVLIVAYPSAFAVFVPLITGEGKLSAKKILLLTFSVILIAIVVSNMVWVVITPKWAFSVTTDKSSYRIGEDLKITVSLRNTGYITHSFKSGISNPVVVSIEYQPTENPTITVQVWYSPYEKKGTEFSVGPNSSLDRDFTWNQTPTANLWYSEEIKPSIYWIQAFIPHPDSLHLGSHPIFSAAEAVNITST